MSATLPVWGKLSSRLDHPMMVSYGQFDDDTVSTFNISQVKGALNRDGSIRLGGSSFVNPNKTIKVPANATTDYLVDKNLLPRILPTGITFVSAS